MQENMIALQKQVRMLRLTVAAMLLAGVAYVSIGAGGDDSHDELRTRKLVVVDAAGNERAILTCEPNSAVLSFLSIDQSASAHLGIGKRGDAFVAVEAPNGDGATLTSGGSGGAPQLVVVHGRESKVFNADFGKPRVSPVAGKD
ncbi:MAG TPA: hypothetical protein VF306_10910 [Pirellulales bacterium]